MLRNKAITMAVSATLLLAHGAARAAEEVGQAYIKGLGTYIFADGDRDVDDDFAGGLLGFGYALSEHFDLELDLQKLNLDGDDIDDGEGGTIKAPDQKQIGLGINLLNIYNRDGRFSPYLLAGGGVVNTKVDGSNDKDDLQLLGGVGALTQLFGRRLALRTEALYRWQDASKSLSDVLINVGFQVALGSRAVAAAPVVAAAPMIAAAPPPAPAPKDSDGDGIVDGTDQCPDTPRGDRVGPQGCSCDITRQVLFKFNSADLTDEGRQTLDELADSLVKLKFVSGTVEGHTDSVGGDDYNQKLSERRARSAADYLQGKGIGQGRMQVAGRGESSPVADNKTAEGRAQNRRVVLRRTDCDAPKQAGR